VKEAIDMIWSCTDVDRIQSLTDVRNSRAIRLLDRVGMTLVGQSAADYKGESCIELSYTLSRS
jgi:RimJ/RimL family protein N-acetyltransferase